MGAARVLRKAILLGDLPAGQNLGEESLGKQLGISRTPIREALQLLQHEGLVELPSNRPAVVRTFTASDLKEMHSLRAVLEGYAARMAADRLGEAEFAALEQSCDRYAELIKDDKDLPALVNENFTFHNTIMRAAGSERLDAMVNQVTALPLIYKSYMTYSYGNREQAWKQHVDILAALRDRDPAHAEEVMKAHVLWALDVALGHLPLLDGRVSSTE